MKALIIEDELPAQMNLQRAIENNFDDIDIVGKIDSVKSAVKWFQNKENKADIVFMDVELSDGMCFDIFKQVDIDAKIIITTAYDSYAIKAFKINSVDYLLKPIDEEELIDAVSKCRKLIDHTNFNFSAIENTLVTRLNKEFKKRFAIKLGNKIVVVNTAEIAYFCSEEKTTFIVTNDNKHYMLDESLDALAGVLDPKEFFRISRAYIVSIGAIKTTSRHPSNRLKLTIEPQPEHNDEVFVSRFRVSDFVKWLDDK